MFEYLTIFAFTISGLVGVLLIIWWWADGRDDDEDTQPSQSPDRPDISVAPFDRRSR